MAKIELLVPFIIKWESGRTDNKLTNEQLFDKAKVTGFANDPDDLGGATMVGITLGTFTQCRKMKKKQLPTVADLKNITYAEWLDVLKTLYWDRWKADEINNQSVANILVDWVWASGTYGIKLPQKLLGVDIDGIAGPKTLAAVNGYPSQKELFDKIVSERVAYLDRICDARPANRKFLKGWLNRIYDIPYYPTNPEQMVCTIK